MKRAFSIFLAMVLTIMALTVTVSAHDGVTYAEWGTPVVDGIREAVWDNAQYIDVADEAMMDVDDETATARVWSLWDGEYIYFFAEVSDITVDAELKENTWDQDALGFMIDYAYNRDEGVSYRDLGANSYAGYVNVAAVEGTENTPEGPSIFGIQEYIDEIESCCKITSKGYDVEIRLPLSLYKSYAAGDKIGYEICVNNSIGMGQRTSQCVWKYQDGAEGNQSWQYTANMGTLILNAKPAAAEPAPAATEPAPAAAEPAAPEAPTPVVVTAPAAAPAAAPQTSDEAVIVIAAAVLCLGIVFAASKKIRIH